MAAAAVTHKHTVREFFITNVPVSASDKVNDPKIRVYIRTVNYNRFLEWMPFIECVKSFRESYPMQTCFTAPASRKDDVVKTLKAHGYTEKAK